jgi:hypothetical protein
MSATNSPTGGTTPPNLSIPSMPAVTGGAENYANRMSAMTSLAQAGNGSLAGGGSRMKRKTTQMRHHNNVTKVMKGCNSKKTKRHNKKKRQGKRIFRGGSSITPAVTGGKIELTMPGGSSPTQVETLQSLTGGLFAAQTAAGNVAQLPPVAVQSKFAGGGVSRRRHRNTKYKRLRYKKSIGRKSRSYRGSRRR